MGSIRSELLDERDRIDRRLRKLNSLPSGGSFRNGSVLALQVRFGLRPKIWTYLAFKADNGRWYFTGRGPQDANWTAVQRWLIKDDKVLVRWTLSEIYPNLSIGPANTRPDQPVPELEPETRRPSWSPGDAQRAYGEEGIEY